MLLMPETALMGVVPLFKVVGAADVRHLFATGMEGGFVNSRFLAVALDRTQGFVPAVAWGFTFGCFS